MSTSGSWSLVDAPTPIKEGVKTGDRSSRTVHLAFTSLASQAAVQHAQGLVGRASPSLLPSPTQATHPEEDILSDRIDPAGVAGLLQATQPEAIFIGSGRSNRTSEALQPFLEAILSSPSSALKIVLLEPAVVRAFTPTQASTLYELARSHSITPSLPLRWASLWTTSVEETLLGLELLHDVREERNQSATVFNGAGAADPDVSVEKSFDVSMSNIPSGLSGDRLNELAELDNIKAQMEQLKRDLGNKDRRIAELTKQADEQQSRAVTQPPALQPAAAKVEPTTPSRLNPAPQGSNSTAVDDTSASLLQPANDLAPTNPRTPASSIRTPTAASAPPTSPLPPTPIPTTSQPLQTLTQPTTPRPTPALQPSAPITSPTSPSSSPNNSRSTGKVIANLTSELATTRALLETTQATLAAVRAQSATHQAAADDMRSTLSRARLENDSSITILARKDRQISEALERARKAESEAKELGRASREWGTRVREVEEELGKERIKRSRAEQAYDTLSSEWKTARERLVEEVKELKQSHGVAVAGLAEEYKKVLTFKDRLKEEWSGYGNSGEGEIGGPQKLVDEVARLNSNMQKYLEQEVQPLIKAQRELERRENTEIVEKLGYLTDELTRIKTLMRRGDITDASQVPPSTL